MTRQQYPLFLSQGPEQLNRVLQRLSSSVSYMTSKNFKSTLSVFMSGQNFMRLERWRIDGGPPDDLVAPPGYLRLQTATSDEDVED